MEATSTWSQRHRRNGRLRDLARAEGRGQAHRRAEPWELPVLTGWELEDGSSVRPPLALEGINRASNRPRLRPLRCPSSAARGEGRAVAQAPSTPTRIRRTETFHRPSALGCVAILQTTTMRLRTRGSIETTSACTGSSGEDRGQGAVEDIEFRIGHGDMVRLLRASGLRSRT